MRKFLSLTTALVSFVALSSASSFAAGVNGDMMNGVGSEHHSGSALVTKDSKSTKHRSMHRRMAHHRATKAHAKKGTHSASATKAKCPKFDTLNKKMPAHKHSSRPKVYLGGVFDVSYAYSSQADNYDIGPAFKNIGNFDPNKRVINTDRNSPSTPVENDSKYANIKNYFRANTESYGNYRDYSQSNGFDASAALKFKIQGNNASTGIIYGAVADVLLSSVGAVPGGPSPFYNNGTYAFASSNYGTFSMGYQDGVETLMRIDASNLSAGDMGVGSKWYNFANLEGRDGSTPFILASGLYTESFLAATTPSGQYVDRANSFIDKAHIRAALPFRLSYMSPLTAGFKVGLSYAPQYKAEAFTGLYDTPELGIGSGASGIRARGDFLKTANLYNNSGTFGPVTFPVDGIDIPSVIAPNYKNVISGGLSYEFKTHNVDISVSAVGEFGSPVKHEDKLVDGLYDQYTEGRDLRSFGIGTKVKYAGIDFAASFASLGKSGTIENIFEYNTNIKGAIPTTKDPVILAKNDVTMKLSNEYSKQCLDGLTCHGPLDTYKIDESSNYFSLGAGYKYMDAYVSATFFRSKYAKANELRHFALGAQYNLAQGKTMFTPYISYNYFWTEQAEYTTVTSVDLGDKVTGDKKVTANVLNSNLNGLSGHSEDNKGSVLLAGIKFYFS